MLGAQVPRRKGETASRRYRRNGYVPDKQEPGRLSGRQDKDQKIVSNRWSRNQPENQTR